MINPIAKFDLALLFTKDT